MVASKLAVILDDILWVLTRSQFLKLSSFVHYLINLRAQYLPLSHKQGTGVKSAPTQTTPPMHGTGQGSNLNQMFSAYDLVETSIHLRLHRIDLHFCDDSMLQGGQSKEDNSDPFNQVGSALQISIMNISLDHCPYHIAGMKRTVIKSDDEVSFQRKRWASQLIDNFKQTDNKHWKTTQRTEKSAAYQASPSSSQVLQ